MIVDDWEEATIYARRISDVEIGPALNVSVRFALTPVAPQHWVTIYNELAGRSREHFELSAISSEVAIDGLTPAMAAIADAYTQAKALVEMTNEEYGRRRHIRMQLAREIEQYIASGT